MSTHFLWQRGAARLQAWGLLDPLQEQGCVPIRTITFDVGPVTLRGIGPSVGGVSTPTVPRRTVLDALLVQAAIDSGAELVEGFVVDGLVWSEGCVVGVEGHPRGSAKTILRARVVVGADGLHSTVARATGARSYQEHPALTGVIYSYWSGLSALGASFYARPDRLILVWPTNDDLTCIYVAWPHDTSVKCARTLKQSSLPRSIWSRAWARHSHPDTANTASSALTICPTCTGLPQGRAGRWSATPVTIRTPRREWACPTRSRRLNCWPMPSTEGSSAATLRGSTVSYQKKRDALTANGFALTLSTARLAPLTPRLEAFYRAAEDQPDVISRIFGVIGGSLPIGELLEDGAYPAS